MNDKLQAIIDSGQVYHVVHQDCSGGFVKCVLLDSKFINDEGKINHLIKTCVNKPKKEEIVEEDE